MKKNYSIKPLILSSFFASLTAICSIVSFPLPFSPVPINLALLSVYLSGALLGPLYGALSQTIYMLLGAIGLPVYHNLTGGLAILTGPTGGFIIGYIVAAFIVGLDKKSHVFKLALRIIAALAACYFLGSLWFMYISGAGLGTTLLLCVIPFLPGDALKILGAVFLVSKLRPILDKIY